MANQLTVTADTITDDQIRALQEDALEAEDIRLADLCRLALGMTPMIAWRLTPYGARIRCAEAVNAAGSERWVTWGSVRGQGPVRSSRTNAAIDLYKDQQGCEEQGGYSDRQVYRIDSDGFVVDEDGENVWPDGHTCPALRIEVQS